MKMTSQCKVGCDQECSDSAKRESEEEISSEMDTLGRFTEVRD